MEAPKIQVKCSVDNCHYNKNRMCHANDLEIDAIGDGRAQTCEGTNCKTFKNTRQG